MEEDKGRGVEEDKGRGWSLHRGGGQGMDTSIRMFLEPTCLVCVLT